MPTIGNSQEPISLYFHIPFCTRKCDYCHFYVLPNKPELHVLLAEGLEKELQLWRDHIQGKEIVSVYFGGGTPFLFGPHAIGRVLEKINEIHPLSTRTEITLEANPEHITQDSMKEYSSVGINRVSIGVQSLDEQLLKRLSRTHGSLQAIQAVDATFHSGIENISIDLMYDIPGQTIETWKHTLERAKTLPISHLSLYNLTIEPHTVFFKYRESITKEMPDIDVSAAMHKLAIDSLTESGFEQYELSAFSKNGRYSRHNVGYWTGRPFLGMGPSAFSYWEGRRFRSTANIHKYLAALREGKFPIDFEEKLADDKKQRELMAIGLRMIQGVNIPKFSHKNGLDIGLKADLERLVSYGLLEHKGEMIALTKRGQMLHDTVAEEIV